MNTVYVVQNQLRADKVSGQLVPKYSNLEEKAAPFGEVRYLLSPSAAPWNAPSVINDLRSALKEYEDGDYLLLIGNPLLIGLAVAIAAEANCGRVTILQWSGKDKSYIPVDAKL